MKVISLTPQLVHFTNSVFTKHTSNMCVSRNHSSENHSQKASQSCLLQLLTWLEAYSIYLFIYSFLV